jgi:hypothetical protein
MSRRIDQILRSLATPRAGLLTLGSLICLTGCGVASDAVVDSASQSSVLAGRLMGGQSPVSGSAMALYAVGTGGDGSAATSIMSKPVSTDANGNFNLTGAYQCPSATSQVYLLATGGNPGLSSSANNADLALMTAIGSCGTLSATSFLQVNEVTTVAATAALAGFVTSGTHVGSGVTDANALAAAMTLATQLANSSNGSTPGAGVPVGTSVPATKINTLADVVASCINTAGGVAGDGSPCGTLFRLTTPASGTAPTDTITALANLAASPSMNTASLYSLTVPSSPFQPVLANAPADFAIVLSAASSAPGLTVSSDSLSFPQTYVGSPSASLALTLSNTASTAVGFAGASLTGPTAMTDFTELDNCPATLTAQSSCSVWIVFTPSAAGQRVAKLSVGSSGPAISVELSGSGVATPPTNYSAALNQGTVFMGASIVNYWPMPMHDVGIPGQITSQMLARFQTDVLGHGYSRVVILGGSNDIIDGVAGVPSELVANIQAMGQMASNAGMEVVLSELPPASVATATGIPFNTTVQQVNAGIKQLAIENGWLVVDYYTPLVNYPQDFVDGLHPNAAGYAVMEAALAGVVSR